MRLGIRREEKGAVAQTEFDVFEREPVGSADEIVEAMAAVHAVHVSETFLEHVIELVGRTRSHPAVELGGSPRAGIALVKTSRARALLHGRDYVVPEDLFALAEDTILHRMRLTYEALAEGLTGGIVLEEMLRAMGAAPAGVSQALDNHTVGTHES
jgi:MoxR-like ATPase